MKLSKIRNDRLRAILNSVMQRRRITRTQLAQTLGLSQASITHYTAMLAEMGLIRDAKGTDPTRGKRPAYIELDSTHWMNLAVIIDFAEIRGVLLDLNGRTLDEGRSALDHRASSDAILQALLSVVAELLQKAKGRHRRILGIGIGVNDYVNSSEGIVYSYFSSSPWEHIPLRDIMEQRFGLPTHLANCQHIGALGVLHSDGLSAARCFLFVWLGRGVSVGVVMNGELCEGENGCAGEFGHVVIEDNGKQCVCGGRGCLETLVSESAILAQCSEALRDGVNSEIASTCGGDLEKLTIAHVVSAANAGDRFTRNVFESVADIVGRQLGNLVNILNPGLIVLRGPIIDNNRFLYESICRVTRSRSLQKCSERLEISYSTEGNDVRLNGLGSIIMRDTTRIVERVSGSRSRR